VQNAHLAEQGQGNKTCFHRGGGPSPTKWALSDRLDRMLPRHKRYCGRSRKTLLIILFVAILCLLALIIGLAAGLSRRKKYGPRIPPPLTILSTAGRKTSLYPTAMRPIPGNSHTTRPAWVHAAKPPKTATPSCRYPTSLSTRYSKAAIRTRTHYAAVRFGREGSTTRPGKEPVSTLPWLIDVRIPHLNKVRRAMCGSTDSYRYRMPAH
jgi:hypothetical protein